MGEWLKPTVCQTTEFEYHPFMKDTKAIGDVTEAVILAELLKARKSVLIPFGERHRYDLVLVEEKSFFRI